MKADTTVRIERLVDAPASAIFDAWTTRDAMETWYCDGEDWNAVVTELDLRVGGRYRVEFGPSGAPPFVETGVYLELERPRRIVIAETLAGVDEPWSDTKVTIELQEQAGKTLLTLLHEGLPSAHHRDLAAGGWPGFLDRLASLVTAA
jgi:uncharacterized protein YndB with AHSA1/START domain